MTNRRDFLVKFTMAAGAVTFLQPLNVFANVGTILPTNSTTKLTILHTANIKGQWSALGVNESMAGLGGLQNIGKKIAEIKKEETSVVVIDAGNLLGYPLQTKEDRLLFYKKVSSAGYDALVPGVFELALGKNNYQDLLKESNLNLDSDNNALALDAALPYSIIKKGKNRIGIIDGGIVALKSSHNTATLHAAAAVSQTAHLLRTSKNCTLIICIVQSPGKKCLKIAGLSSGVDVMISTVENSLVYNTQIVRNKMDHEVILSYAGTKGAMMSRIDLTLNEKGEKINVATKAILTGAENETYAGILKRCTVYNA